MLRGLLTTCGIAGALAGAGVAQIPAHRIHPVTVPVRDAGTLDLASGTWLGGAGPGARGQRSTVVFHNTCAWTGGVYYFGPEHCEDVYDEGRIPSTTSPGPPVGATDDNRIDSFQIGYCTHFPTGQVDIRIAFFERMDPCAGWTVQQPIVQSTGYNGATAYFDLSGLGLPGDNAGGGNLACWSVTIDLSNTLNGGFCVLSDGDGSWSGIDNNEFGWAFQHENDNAVYGFGGPLLGGDPLVASWGACSYTIPCGTDPWSGLACGTGLGTQYEFWLNTDGTPVGGPVNTALCPNGGNTGCYWFQGPPDPPASFWMKMTSSGSCDIPWCDPPAFYCLYKDPEPATACGFKQCPSSGGCRAAMFTSSIAMQPVSDADDYDVGFLGAQTGKPGLIFGTTSGRASISPFSSGTLCCWPPISRSPVRNTGTQGAPCTGLLELRINRPGSAIPILNPRPGTVVNYQGWMRDPMSAAGTDVTDAVEVTFQPGADHLGHCHGTQAWSVSASDPAIAIVPYTQNRAAYLVDCKGPGEVRLMRNGAAVKVLGRLDSARIVTGYQDVLALELHSGTEAEGHWRKE